ncbi:hypothetical protein GCM10010424_37110 [Streptomyces lienomycini]
MTIGEAPEEGGGVGMGVVTHVASLNAAGSSTTYGGARSAVETRPWNM